MTSILFHNILYTVLSKAREGKSMEIRVLRYFLAVAREESISKAAQALHITQPTLSRQIMDLERELGCKLFSRGGRNHKLTLTQDGLLLRKRAEEITTLIDKTESEFSSSDSLVSGDIYIGGGETDAMRIIARAARELKKEHPGIRYHLFSGNADDVTEKLDSGLLDFGILIEPADIGKYNYIRLPATDRWGLLMVKDSPLAEKERITPTDLEDLPLIVSRQTLVRNEISGWTGGEFERLNIVATYNLVFNASLMVDEGFGYALCLDKLVNTSRDSGLCFRPLYPQLEAHLDIVWKKYREFSKAEEKFLSALKSEIEKYDEKPL